METQVLVVEDEEVLRKAMQRYLVRAGYAVLSVGSGEAAVEAMRQGQHFDVILTDLNMPGLHGADLIRSVRELDPHVPIVFLTGNLSRECERSLAADGAFQCLEKPVEADLLMQIVHDAALESDKWKLAH